MGKKMILLFSHNLTNLQIEDAKASLQVEEILYLPANLQEIWSNVNPEIDERENLEEIKKYVRENLNKNDFVLIQGEWGYSYEMVKWSKNESFVPIYSASRRDYQEEVDNEGNVINTHIFKHVKYKIY